MPGYDTKITPAPNPMIVDPHATMSVVFAVAPTIFEEDIISCLYLEQSKNDQKEKTHSTNQNHHLSSNQHISTTKYVTQATRDGERDC